MNYKKKYQEDWNRQYGWVYKFISKGRTQYVLAHVLALLFFSLMYILLTLWPVGNLSSQDMSLALRIIIFILFFSVFTALFIGARMRYWRDDLILRAILGLSVSAQSFVTGFALVSKSEQVFTFLLLAVGLSAFFVFRNYRREAERWELARRKGFLKRYLDEQNWVFDNDPYKWHMLWLDLAAAEKTVEQQKSLLKWLTRLEKLHFLIPGIMISFRRAFGHEEIILGVLVINLGLIVASTIQMPVYLLKIRKWEKEKGKPISLREIWKKEQQQGN